MPSQAFAVFQIEDRQLHHLKDINESIWTVTAYEKKSAYHGKSNPLFIAMGFCVQKLFSSFIVTINTKKI